LLFQTDLPPTRGPAEWTLLTRLKTSRESSEAGVE
jgi:hypothetical protein